MKYFCKVLTFLYIQSWCSETPNYGFRKCCPLKMSTLSLLPAHHVEKIKVKADAQINYKTNKQNQAVLNKRCNHYSKDIFISQGVLFPFSHFQFVVSLLVLYSCQRPQTSTVSGVCWEVNTLNMSNHLVSLLALSIIWSD